jgi:hypothetical protein
MNLFTAIQLAAILAIFIIIANVAVQRHWPVNASASRRWFFWLLALSGAILLLLYMVRLLFPQVEMRFGYFLAAACLPVVLGMLALLFLDVGAWAGLSMIQKVLALLALAVVIVLVFFTFQKYGYGLILLISAVVLAIAWSLNKLPRGFLVGLGVVVFLILCVWLKFVYGIDYAALPVIVRSLLGPLQFSLPVLSILIAAALIYAELRDAGEPGTTNKINWRSLAVRSGLALLLIGALAIDIYWISLWDQTTDGVGGIFAATYSSVSAIAVGMIIGVRLSGERKWAAVLFIVLFPLVLFGAFRLGNGADYQALTAQRAGRIQAALEGYKTKNGSYPPDLQALVPGELLVVPQPLVFPGEGWCYQAGSDSYQLSTYYRRYFSTPLSLHIYASAGNPPSPDQTCQNHLDELKQKNEMGAYPAP